MNENIAANGGSDQLCDLSAIELTARIRRGEVSAREVMAAHLARIERLNPKVNAIVTLVAERAMAGAAQADELAAKGGTLGVLHGLPVAHKDLVDTAGIRTTLGSLFYRDNVPTSDAAIVTRIRAAGAITCGKTNTPEFGAGSQTFNSVFGATRNPYDMTKTCGGSSGGAAVALACGMLPIADGSDAGGSLRNPAAFCNVVGLRPSPGRVPGNPGWSPIAVLGPMARSVADVALFLSAIAGSGEPALDPGRRRPVSRPARR
jgi:amidase